MQWYAVIDDFYGCRVCKLDPLGETDKTITVVATKETGFKRRWLKRNLHDNYNAAASEAASRLAARIQILKRKLSNAEHSLAELESNQCTQ